MADPIRILVVDDEFSIVASLREILEWEGYAVDTAPNGRLGLEAAKARKPDVILLDVMMPVMDGLSMLRRLKEDPATQSIPVIVMSAAPIRISPARGGYFSALAKPFEVKSVIDRIKAATLTKEKPEKAP